MSVLWNDYNQAAIQCDECKEHVDPSHLSVVSETLITCYKCANNIHEFMSEVAGHLANEHMIDDSYDDESDNCETIFE
jgi:lipopolysaccharide biosynthesis regulator YciM